MKAHKILSLISFPVLCLTTSCGQNFEAKYNAYANQYQRTFFDNITYQYKDWYNCSDLHINSQAESVILWTYGPGYTGWGTLLHQGYSDEQMAQHPDIPSTLGIPDARYPRDLNRHIDRPNLNLRTSDFHFLDDALNLTTAGKPITLFHGYECNEVEMMNTINSTLGVSDILTMTPEQTRDIDCSKLVGKTIIDKCWCATTFEESFALGWADGNVETESHQTIYNVPVYKLDVDPGVHCAYVSYSEKTWFDGIYLAWPHEYQVLTERGLTFNIENVRLVPRNKHQGYFLYISCHVQAKN